jgi:hypothetical protein
MAEFRTVRLIGTLLGATLVLSGCQKKGDAISSAEQTEKINGIAAPGISENQSYRGGRLHLWIAARDELRHYERMLDQSNSQQKVCSAKEW